MKKKYILLLLFFSCSMLSASAQINEQEAFQTFKKAREAFRNENFETSSKLFLKTKELLGSTNIRIQPMLIKSLAGIEDWRQAKTEITNYYRLNPDKELVEYQEIVNIEKKIENKIYEEEQLYSSAKSNKSVSQYQSYLNTYPYGKYQSEVQNLLGNQKDENAWERANKARSISGYYEYLDNFPDGNYSTTAKETIKILDDEAYEKAIAEGTQETLNYYLDNYPRGKFRSTVRNKLTERKEYDVYIYAKNHNYIENYEAYINKYPNGKYALEVNRIIENSYYRFGNEAYDSKKYGKAKGYYETYISKFPFGTYSSEVRSKIKKCQNKLNQRSASFLMYTYDSESPIGISIGNINKNRAGYYLNLKMNPEIFSGFDVIYKIDDAGNHDRPGDVVRTGDVKYANISFSGGVTFKIAYPLWAYIGGGVGYFPVYEHVETYYSSGNYWEDDWLRNTDKTKSALFPEGGLKLKVANALVLKYGIMHREGLIHQFGFGFQL